MKVNDGKSVQVLAKESFLKWCKVQFLDQFYSIFSKIKKSDFSIRRCNSVNSLVITLPMLPTTGDFDRVVSSLEDSAETFFGECNDNLFRSNKCHRLVILNNDIGINDVGYDLTSSKCDLKEFREINKPY